MLISRFIHQDNKYKGLKDDCSCEDSRLNRGLAEGVILNSEAKPVHRVLGKTSIVPCPQFENHCPMMLYVNREIYLCCK